MTVRQTYTILDESSRTEILIMQRYLPSVVPDDDTRAASILSARPPTLAAPSPVFQILSSAASRSPWSSRYYLESPSFSSPVIAPFQKTTVEPIAHRLPATNVRLSKCQWRCRQSSFIFFTSIIKVLKTHFLNKDFINIYIK